MDLSCYREAITSTLSPLIPSHTPVALFDYPNYGNVGDSAIWLGELAFLNKNRNPITYIGDLRSEKHSLPALPPEAIVLINGGGNFGDLYPKHQELRRSLLKAFPDNRIIQLPQSLFFQSPQYAKASGDFLNTHRDFHLLVRDHESLNIAHDIYCGPIQLCPDMALFMTSMPTKTSARYDIVGLLRTDQEKAYNTKISDENLHFSDWLEENPLLSQAVYYSAKMNHLIRRSKSITATKFVYLRVAEARLKRGCDILSSGRVVITDRLHAHILCTMMEIPHVVLDNSYGKIANFRAAWKTGENGLCQQAISFEHAEELASSMLRSLQVPQPDSQQ